MALFCFRALGYGRGLLGRWRARGFDALWFGMGFLGHVGVGIESVEWEKEGERDGGPDPLLWMEIAQSSWWVNGGAVLSQWEHKFPSGIPPWILESLLTHSKSR